MKKYRLTKITVKTREIISVPNNQSRQNQTSVCPVCHTPLSASLPAKQSSAGAIKDEQRPAELPAANISGD